MDKTQLIKNYSTRIEDTLGNVYSSGYEEGYTEGKKEAAHMRATCTRTKGEHDAQYAKNWDDDTTFYGWCSECERPHSGRWAHMWEFCPWCGARIDHKADAPYPMGIDAEELKKPSVQEVVNIPKEPRPVTQRDLIRSNLEEAVQNRISQFELINDAYKYDTLANNAKETLERWFRLTVYYPAQKRAKERLKNRISEPFWTTDWFKYKQRAFTITKRKLEDRTHVYVTLKYDVIDNIEQIIYDDTLKKYQEEWPEEIINDTSNAEPISLSELEHEHEISRRMFTTLAKGRVLTTLDLTYITEEELLKIRNFGKHCMEETKAFCEEKNIALGSNHDNIPTFTVGDKVKMLIDVGENPHHPALDKGQVCIVKAVNKWDENKNTFHLTEYKCVREGAEEGEHVWMTPGAIGKLSN